jgi:hypothetical protein
MSWLYKISNNIDEVGVSILYHATYRAYVSSILEHGLIPRYHCTWADCEYGVYLATEPFEAMSYPETADNPDIPNDYFDEDQIVVFAIDISKLDKTKLVPDPNVIYAGDPKNRSTWMYRDIIPNAAFLNADRIKKGQNGL